LRRPELDWEEWLTAAWGRVTGSFWAAAQAALAAALAWFIAHRLLGHAQPFFAPIAAAIAMSTSHFGRSRRAFQMVVGVLLGIGIAELLTAVIGNDTLAIGVIVLVTMLVALALGGGFVGEGMMFVNQAAASAILVVALKRHGTGGERALDALVGGASALLVGVVLFPAAPLPRLWAAERSVLESLADALEHLSELLEGDQSPDAAWTLTTGYRIHDRLSQLAQARMHARSNVRIAPRRWHLRPLVDAEDQRVARFDLLANALLSMVRATIHGLEDQVPLPAWLKTEITALAVALRTLARTPQPWPSQLIGEVEATAQHAIDQAPFSQVDRVPTISSIMRATARDLIAVLDQPG
jgi:uncharacterized membrane protein YgaE (UPF0421/DUF939 family)